MPPHLIQALQNPDVWPGSDDQLDVHETHISWVFVTGRYAWKIKKPVCFEFLDFSTLDHREHFCREELRLNRRLAPELYLDVIPITGTPRAPCVGGDGDPIEFAVQMRRFEQTDLFLERAVQGELQADEIDDVADQTAQFHQGAVVASALRSCGSTVQIQKAAEGNFNELRPGIKALDTASVVDDLAHWSAHEFECLRSRFEERRQQGFVRECHGDLHLGNIARVDGRACIFDGVEFNDDFRWIDVMSEVAFLLMDLDEHGYSKFAWRFLNRYLEQTGDFEGLSVLPFYLVYRCLVRAKVDAIRLRDPSLSVTTRRGLSAELRAYLNVADHDAHPADPMLILMHGLSGSGKSTVSQALLEQLGAVRIRSDVERKRLFEPSPGQSPSHSSEWLYAPETTHRTYDRLRSLSQQAVEAGFTTIVDATFLRREQRQAFQALTAEMSVPLAIVSCTAPAEEMARRIDVRRRTGRDASDATASVLAAQTESAEPFQDAEKVTLLQVDTTLPGSVNACVERLRTLQASHKDQDNVSRTSSRLEE